MEYHDGNCATDEWLRFRLSDDWKLSSQVEAWESIAAARRREREANPPLDARAVLYGKPLLEFIARECLRAFAGAPAPPDDVEPWNHPDAPRVREIHALWLTTPRDDLRGRAPRDLLLERRDCIGWDLQHRQEQWSALGECPRGLDRDSAAFRFAGFGTHEIVTYYDLVRELVWSCRAAVAALPAAAQLTPGDFLTTEVPRLERLREERLDAPDPEFHGRTPRSIIDNERARVSETVSGEEAIIDPDCPLCAMAAELPGPAFWGLDGCNMDDEFAFSFHRTRAEWDEEQREHAEFDRRWNEREAERKRLGLKYADEQPAASDAVWQRSFAAPETAETSCLMRLFGIGTNLAELIVDLKGPHEERELIDRLHRDFGNLREVAQSPDSERIDALLEPVLARFCETLDAAAAARPELEQKAADLERRVRRFADPPDEADDFEDWDDVPF
ncbi:MAG: hypothetical protein WD069_16070 [Planctomycetales bacterium]